MNNPLIITDPTGQWPQWFDRGVIAIGNWTDQTANNHSTFNWALNHPLEIAIVSTAPLDIYLGATAVAGSMGYYGLLRLGNTCLSRCGNAAEITSSVSVSRINFASGKSGNSLQNLQDHWTKHQSEFPELSNEYQYAQKADRFVNSPPKDAIVRNLSNNRAAVYQPSTNTLGFKQNGAPSSLYRPNPSTHGYKTNIDYFKSLK